MPKSHEEMLEQSERLVDSGARHIRLYTQDEDNNKGSFVAGLLEFNGDSVIVDGYPVGEKVHFGWDSLTGIKYIFEGAKICWRGDPSLPEACRRSMLQDAFAFCRFKDWKGTNLYCLSYGQKYSYVPIDRNGMPHFEAAKLLMPPEEVTPCCWSKELIIGCAGALVKCSVCRRRLLRCEHCGQLTAMAAGELDHEKHRCEHCGKPAVKRAALTLFPRGRR